MLKFEKLCEILLLNHSKQATQDQILFAPYEEMQIIPTMRKCVAHCGV